MNTYKNVNKKKRGNILQDKSDFKEIILPILENNDYLMIKGSNATGLNKISKNLTKERVNVIWVFYIISWSILVFKCI